MDNEHSDVDEPLIRGLGEIPASAFDMPEPDLSLREAIFARTATVVRGRRKRRRLAGGLALILAYGIGIVTARLWLGAGPSGAGDPIEAMQERHRPEKQEEKAAPEAPEEIERRAFPAPREERIRLLKLAGDQYLVDYCDVDGALRCYRKYLDLVHERPAAAPGPNDSWLLLAMKQSRT